MIIVYLLDNLLVIVNKGKVYERVVNSINQGNIVNREAFIESFLKLIKEHDIKTKLFGGNIYVVKNVFYNNRDIYFMDSIFKEIGFNKVIYIDIKKFLNENYSYIEINKDYMVIYNDDCIKIDLKVYPNIKGIISYFKKQFKGEIILFGTSSKIPEIGFRSSNVYYLKNPSRYIYESLLKVKKIGK